MCEGGLGTSSPAVFHTPLTLGARNLGMSHQPAAPELDPTKGQRAGLASGQVLLGQKLLLDLAVLGPLTLRHPQPLTPLQARLTV